MAAAIRSFDVFDTLIARRCVEPQRVFETLERRAGIPGLAADRISADREIAHFRKTYGIKDIWTVVADRLRLDHSTVDRLTDLELRIEHEEVIPIVENLSLVRDGDLLVSDTYLPNHVVRSLLRHAGLERTVGLMVSNDGKFRGWIWPELLARFPLSEHWGDNPHSDGHTPSAAGLRAIIYTGANFTPVERLLAERGWRHVACIAREARLANPYRSGTNESHLWLLTCQLNFPLLYFGNLWLDQLAAEKAARELFFVSRDGLLWHALWERMFPERRSTYLFTSRKCLLKPTDAYIAYFPAVWHPESLIVDLTSTGISWSTFLARVDLKARFFCLGHVDNYAYMEKPPRIDDRMELNTVFRNSELRVPMSKGVEILNYAPHPLVEDVQWIAGCGAQPRFSETLEYPVAFPEAARRAFHTCVNCLGPAQTWERTCTRDMLKPLIEMLVALIGTDQRLGVIYAGHQEADERYIQQLVS